MRKAISPVIGEIRRPYTKFFHIEMHGRCLFFSSKIYCVVRRRAQDGRNNFCGTYLNFFKYFWSLSNSGTLTNMSFIFELFTIFSYCLKGGIMLGIRTLY